MSRVAGLTVEYEGIKINTTISIGTSRVSHDSVDGMIADGDALLYQAKRADGTVPSSATAE